MMNYLQRSREFFHSGAQSVSQQLENKNIKRIKKITIIIFAFLFILDVFLVLPNPFPTISSVVLASSPKYMFIIWVWGIITANLFFSRNVVFKFGIRLISLVCMIAIITALYFAGKSISEKSESLNFDNIEIKTTSAFTEIICYNSEGNKIDCVNNRSKYHSSKYDLTTESKFILLLTGFVFGYFLWPQAEKKPGGIVS